MRGGSEIFPSLCFDSLFDSTFQPTWIFRPVNTPNKTGTWSRSHGRQRAQLSAQPVSGTPLDPAPPAEIAPIPPPPAQEEDLTRTLSSRPASHRAKAETCPHHHPADEGAPCGFPGTFRRHTACLVRRQARHHDLQRRKHLRQVAARREHDTEGLLQPEEPRRPVPVSRPARGRARPDGPDAGCPR